MSRKWKPGDVAIVANEVAMFVDQDGDRFWITPIGTHWRVFDAPQRPLVVIDPEDREGVLRLMGLYYHHLSGGHEDEEDYSELAERMQAALREFADPKPPRIDEPGTWGVVEASCAHSESRREWVKFPSGNWHTIREFDDAREDIESPDNWDSLVEPVLIREGVR